MISAPLPLLIPRSPVPFCACDSCFACISGEGISIMLAKLLTFVTLTALSGFGLVMTVSGTGAKAATAQGCCSGNACGLCEDCTCACVDGCRCCDGEPCLCGDACSCKCCDLSAKSAATAATSAGKLTCCAANGKCSLDTQAILAKSSTATTSAARAAGACCSDNACGLCETCTCDCVAGCACCTGEACLCGDGCQCLCCETAAAGS